MADDKKSKEVIEEVKSTKEESTLYYFTSTGCAFCKQLDPIIEELNNGDYQLCCPPTDTSPPFNASEEGLDTISGTSPNMEIHKGNLIFDSLIIQDTNSNASDATASGTVNRKIDIKTPSGTFKILAFDP